MQPFLRTIARQPAWPPLWRHLTVCREMGGRLFQFFFFSITCLFRPGSSGHIPLATTPGEPLGVHHRAAGENKEAACLHTAVALLASSLCPQYHSLIGGLLLVLSWKDYANLLR